MPVETHADIAYCLGQSSVYLIVIQFCNFFSAYELAVIQIDCFTKHCAVPLVALSASEAVVTTYVVQCSVSKQTECLAIVLCDGVHCRRSALMGISAYSGIDFCCKRYSLFIVVG